MGSLEEQFVASIERENEYAKHVAQEQAMREQLTQNLIHEIESQGHIGLFRRALKYIPKLLGMIDPKKRTLEMCETAIIVDWESLSWVPQSMITELLCWKAVRLYGLKAYQFVPSQFQTLCINSKIM